MTRIIDLIEKTEADSTDYIIVDDESIGTRKMSRATFLAGIGSGGSGVPLWQSIASTNSYQASAGDRLACFASSTPVRLPDNPAVGDEVQFVGIDCTSIAPRFISNITKLNGETVIGARLVDKFNGARLIYLGDPLGWICDRAAAIVARYNSVSLTYSASGDTNGLIYYLGTNNLTEIFANPHTRGSITLTASSTLSPNPVSVLSNRVADEFYTNTAANSWVKLKINAAFRLRPNYYTWRGRGSGSGAHPRSWKLRASHDDINWIDLDTQTNNTSINATNAYFAGAVSVAQTSYQYFQFILTGVDSSGSNYLTGNEWELYGDLFVA